MNEVRTLDIAFWNYDRTRALIDGSVRVAGAALRYRSDVIVSDIFKRMIRDREFDVAELGLTFYLRTLEAADPPFVALPIFPNRFFRHSSIFVNRASGIAKPADLAGKRVGELSTFGHDAGVWAKGILADEYGVAPDALRYVIGGVDEPSPPHDWIPQPHPPHVVVERIEPGKALGPMLEAGEIDALFSAIVPNCVLAGSPQIGRLFDDYEAVERDYFRRTRIFPIMHTVVMRRDLYAESPELAAALFEAFCAAKERAVQQYLGAERFHHAPLMVPWFSRLLADDRRLLGPDWWPYGVTANRTALDTFLRYHHEQGLSTRRLTVEELFVPELLGT